MMSEVSNKKRSVGHGNGGGADDVSIIQSVGESLVEYMNAHLRDATVQGEACKKIAALATTDEGAANAVDQGCLGCIITAMRNHSTHSRVQELACLALRRIAAHGSTSRPCSSSSSLQLAAARQEGLLLASNGPLLSR
jgi:hypothetical protein